jgi:hypothetical protein
MPPKSPLNNPPTPFPINSRFFPVLPDASRCFSILPDSSRCFPMLPDSRDRQGQAGTSRDRQGQAGTGRDRQGLHFVTKGGAFGQCNFEVLSVNSCLLALRKQKAAPPYVGATVGNHPPTP